MPVGHSPGLKPSRTTLKIIFPHPEQSLPILFTDERTVPLKILHPVFQRFGIVRPEVVPILEVEQAFGEIRYVFIVGQATVWINVFVEVGVHPNHFVLVVEPDDFKYEDPIRFQATVGNLKQM